MYGEFIGDQSPWLKGCSVFHEEESEDGQAHFGSIVGESGKTR